MTQETTPRAALLERPRANEAILGRYLDEKGRDREVLRRPGMGGSMLVVDRDARTRSDHRLIAHLPSDEPLENASLVTRQYLHQPSRRCRALLSQDCQSIPFAEEEAELCAGAPPVDTELRDRSGSTYRLRPCGEDSIAQLRWCRSSPAARREHGHRESSQAVSVRVVLAALESYEPVRTLTLAALVAHRDQSRVSITTLHAEFERIKRSPIVLNRGVRAAVVRAVRVQGLSLSEIASRCGRVKYDARGRPSGETSWLSRRVGLVPEGGGRLATPWIHSEVLALIARTGLGLSPRDVELG